MQETRCAQLYEKYRIEAEIGRGASGVCYRVQHAKTKEQFVMKKIHVSSIKKQNTREACSEVQILSKLNHQNIIRLHQFFADEGHVYIIMQYANRGDLHQILKRRKIRRDLYPEKQIWEMARQLLKALEYLHSHNIIHRDVKTLNIFMDNNSKLYLGDLGVSKILKNDAGLYSRVGTPLYLAPQIIRNEKYDYKADIWGLGCVCYHIAALTHPFEGKNIISLGQNIVGASPKYIDEYSNTLNEFITQMLQKNPKKRPGADQLLKKYFVGKIPLQVEQKDQKSQLKQQKLIFQRINKISGSKNIFGTRPTGVLKRKVLNNFIEEKLSLSKEDIIKPQVCIFDSRQRSDDSKAFDQTLLLGKKPQIPEETKKFSQVTRKTYLVAKTENIQSLRNIEPKSEMFPQNLKEKQSIVSLFSQKKMVPPITIEIAKLSKNTGYPSLASFQKPDTKKIDTGQMQKPPSEINFTSKARIRPKSSIMTKQRHQNTMKNIRKYYRKDLEDSNRLVQLCILQKPQMIIL